MNFKLGDKVKTLIPAAYTNTRTGTIIGCSHSDYIHVKIDNYNYKKVGTLYHGFRAINLKKLNSGTIKQKLGVK